MSYTIFEEYDSLTNTESEMNCHIRKLCKKRDEITALITFMDSFMTPLRKAVNQGYELGSPHNRVFLSEATKKIIEESNQKMIELLIKEGDQLKKEFYDIKLEEKNDNRNN